LSLRLLAWRKHGGRIWAGAAWSDPQAMPLGITGHAGRRSLRI